MTLLNGYEMESTFIMDFSIADRFGIAAIKDTYKRAFKCWKDNHIYLTELVIALNLKIWEHWNAGRESIARVYDELWRKAQEYAYDNLKGDELAHFCNVTN